MLDTKYDHLSVEKEKYNISFLQILKLNAPEWKLLLIGVIGASILGASFPVWAIVFGDFFAVICFHDFFSKFYFGHNDLMTKYEKLN